MKPSTPAPALAPPLAVALALAACTTTTSEVRRTPLGESSRLVAGSRPTIGATWALTPGLLRGQVAWLNTCERSQGRTWREDTIETTQTNTTTTLVGVGLSVLTFALSGLLISQADTFSDVEECERDDDGDVTCSSPRESAYAFGILGVLVGLGGAGYGVVTLFAEPTEELVDSTEGYTETGRQPDLQPCGTGPVADLALAVVHQDQVVARATTNTAGEVAFAVPAEVAQADLRVVVDAVTPGQEPLIRPGSEVTSP